EGLSNKEIAARLLLGVSTVKNHVHNVLSKVDARTRSEAVALLLEGRIQTVPKPEAGSRTPLRA
ncbi:MAG: LuxR C-terminal-related transcriptional regulator, partial [Actinomycetota bacterium]|nr:LuxR C-terminal-related transcriptional regulator [Actinomycetota bacterium]